MSITVATKATGGKEWLEKRREGLGGSDMPAVLGVSPFASQLDVYLSKVRTTECRPSKPMERGKYLEPIIADVWSRETGIRLQHGNAGLPTGILQSVEHPWAIANIDRVVVGKKELVEIKCLGLKAFAECKSRGIPSHIQIQAQHYMFVTGYPLCLVIVFNAERWEHITIEVNRDEEIIQTIIDRGSQFWYNNVLPRVPPRISREILPEIENVGAKITSIESPELDKALQDYDEAVEIISGGSALKEEAKKRIAFLAGENDAIETATHRIYYRSETRKTIDKKRLSANYPEIDLSKYQKESAPTKTLRVYRLGGNQ